MCDGFGYTLHLTVRFKKGKAVALYGLKVTDNSDDANAAYWNRAWKPVVKNILSHQNADVDAVSGATLSSNGILEGVTEALKESEG